MPSTVSTQARARARIFLRIALATLRGYKRVYSPFVELGIRLTVAQAFFYSGMLKAMNWDAALYLARYEYPLSWLSWQHAAVLGVTIELVCPVLLALGLFTRAAALALTSLAIVVQANYQVLDANIIWAAILLTYVVMGARGFSLDRLIMPGLGRSALPLVRPAVLAAERFTRSVAPAFQLGLRLWLAWTLLRLPASPSFFPVSTVHALLPVPVSIVAGIMLALGLGASVVDTLLVVASVGMQMMVAGTPQGLWLIVLLAQLSPGRWSLNHLLFAALNRWTAVGSGMSDTTGWPRVVIVGAGFGGMACAAKLRHLPVHVTIVDRNNHHLFQPLLYQVATAGLSPADVASPIRSQFRDDANVHVLMGTVTGVEAGRKRVCIGNDERLEYDILILATGASHAYFGRDEWAPFAPGLKRIEDATAIRGRLLAAFERAESAIDEDERTALLKFVIVGGGPTGVELAGALAELACFGLQHEFRHINPADARIILVQSGERVLPTFPESLSEHARRSLKQLGVDVRLNSKVEEIDGVGVTIAGECIPAGTVLWAAGVAASPAASWLGVEPDRTGRVPVDERLGVYGHPDVFVIGDIAASKAWNGELVPGLAPAAKQGGEYVAALIRTRLELRPAPAPFRYRLQGSLATIGRKAAVADFGRLKLWGAPAWWLWGIVHLLFLSGLRNRIAVVGSWIWAYLTFRNGSRLITSPR